MNDTTMSEWCKAAIEKMEPLNEKTRETERALLNEIEDLDFEKQGVFLCLLKEYGDALYHSAYEHGYYHDGG